LTLKIPPSRVLKRARVYQAPLPARVGVATIRLPELGQAWDLDARAAGLSARYRDTQREVLQRLTWYLSRERIGTLDQAALRRFFAYLQGAHLEPGGRWDAGDTRSRAPLSDSTLKDWYRRVRTFLNWLVEQHVVDTSPLGGVRQPIHRTSGLGFHVFTQDEIRRLQAAAQGPRDVALVLLLLDTGLRATEVCGLVWGDLDLVARRANVRAENAKGGRVRAVHWSRRTGSALWRWIQALGGQDPDAPVFPSIGNKSRGQALTRVGLGKLCARLGADAAVPHCHPHTFRHTFATLFLLSGGQQRTLMELMGHTSLSMTMRYVRFTGADLAAQARVHSPVEYAHRRR